MEKEGNTCGMCGGGKMGSMCGCGNWSRHHILRWFLGIVIIFIVFWTGMQIGELKGSLERGGWSGQTHSRPMMYGSGSNMMDGSGNSY